MLANIKRHVIAATILALTLALCSLGAGCSPSTSASEPSAATNSASSAAESQDVESAPAESAAAETAAEEPSDVKPAKDGFDTSTNTIVNVAGVDFQVPTYFGEKNEKDSYYAENGQGVTMLQLSMFDNTTLSDKEFSKAKGTLADSFVDGISKSASEVGKPTVEDAVVAGFPAATVSFDFKMSGITANTKGVFFLNSAMKKIGLVYLCQSEESSFDYFADFDKIVASAVKGEVKSSAPTLGSTIEYDGLTIEFGTDLQTTTINNQFSNHDGETILFVPVKITNNSDKSTHLNMYAVKAFGSQGTELDMVFTYFDDDARMAGDMRPGASQEANLYFLYDGNGTYYLDFGFYKTEVEVEVPVQL